MTKKIALAALTSAFLAAVPLSAEAFPVSPAPAGADQGHVTLVAGGCGIGFHRGPFGGCRPNRVIIRRPIVCRIFGLPPRRVCRRW